MCRRAAVVTLGVLAVAGLAACGGGSDAPETGGVSSKEMSADDKAAVDKALSLVDQGLAPGNGYWIGIWDPEKGVYIRSSGEAAPGRAAKPDDNLRIGSITKTFTASVILQLIDEGKLTLDDPVEKHLPDLVADLPQLRGITVRQLLNMTSGIADYLNVPNGVVAQIVEDPQRVWTAEELIRSGVEAGVADAGTPGYSTTNYLILQLIAEKLDGRPLAKAIDERLATPLDLDDTTLPPNDDTTLPDPAATAHLNELCVLELKEDGATGVTTDTDPTDWSLSSAQGGGAMNAAIGDLGKWAASMSGNSLLSEGLRSQRLRTKPIGPGLEYGLGIMNVAGWYGHEGETIGSEAIALHNPKTGVSFAMAANSCAGQTIAFLTVLNALYPSPELNKALTGG